MRPNYEYLGLSMSMGKLLRKEVESQLLKDLEVYGVNATRFKFDWSESCIEGHRAEYLDGALEDYSSIMLFNENDELVVDGWMEFILEKERNIFIVYWDLLDVYDHGKEIVKKDKFGIPNHVLHSLPLDLKDKYKDF